ncbi:lipopolysaccharide biosynthesis protein [Erythrobacter sp. HKB08]|uniref:lipopolysaccharide biosynthesis protein n=1 Tax=Erythrobacter sp. HKB08 TaxID=2502843 RepID=UPI001008FAE3|nr:hypothetical protein [Erythrobacter sp. HKB08]
MTSIGQRMISSGAASATSLVTRVAEQLLLIPVLLAAWSVELFGEYLLIAAIPTYIALSDLGVVQSGSNELARRAGEGDEEGAHRFFRDLVVTFLRWSLLLLVVLAAVVMAVPLADWLGLRQISSAEAKWTFGLLAAAAIISQNSLALLGGMRARRIMPAGLWTRAIGTILRLAATFIAVKFFDTGPVAIGAIMLASRIGEYAAQSVILRRADFAATLNLFARRSQKLGRYVASGLEYLMFDLAKALLLQGAVIIIGLTLGAVAVAVFSTHRTLARAVSQIVQTALVPLQAEAGLMGGASQRTGLARLVIATTRLAVWTCLAVALALFVAGPAIFELWTGGKIAFAPELYGLLVGAVLFEAVWMLTAQARMGTNRHRPIAWSFLAVAACAVAGMSASVTLVTAAAVLLVAEIVMCLVAIPLTVSLLDMRVGAYLRAILRFPSEELRFLKNRLLPSGH